MIYLKFNNSKEKNNFLPEYEFYLGNAYYVFSPIDHLLRRLLEEKIISKKKIIVQEDNLESFHKNYRKYSINRFLDKYDQQNLGYLFFSLKREFEINLDDKMLRLDNLDIKCLNFIYLLSRKKQEKVFFTNDIGLGILSKFGFFTFIKHLIPGFEDVSIIHIIDSKIWNQNIISRIGKFNIYNVNDIKCNTYNEFYNFYYKHYVSNPKLD